MYRIGFACKFKSSKLKKDAVLEEAKYNSKTTTVSALARMSTVEKKHKIYYIVEHNAASLANMLEYVASLDQRQHMFRISSDMFPLYTHAVAKDVYDSEFETFAFNRFTKAASIINEHNIRISMHPGQFVVLASHNPRIVQNSIAEFEYHVRFLQMLGFAKQFQDAKCNIHLSGREGVAGFRKSFALLSKEAQRVITVENDEYQSGIDKVLEVSDLCPIVLDVHHHWIATGEYISPIDPRAELVKKSWRNTRPTMHYAVSREDYVVDHPVSEFPDLSSLLESGFKKGKLRAHSDMMWNSKCNTWAKQFLQDFDIMVESKCKNLAAQQFFNEVST